MNETQSIADYVIPVVTALVESHQSQLINPPDELRPKLLLHIRTLGALLESTASVTEALIENDQEIPNNILAAILVLQAECATKILRLAETPSEANATMPLGHRLPTNLDRLDQ